MSNEPATNPPTDPNDEKTAPAVAADAHSHGAQHVGDSAHAPEHPTEQTTEPAAHEPAGVETPVESAHQHEPASSDAAPEVAAASHEPPPVTEAPTVQDAHEHDVHAHEDHARVGHETHSPEPVSEELVPVPAPVSEELVPVEEPAPELAADAATEAGVETPAESVAQVADESGPAPEPVAEAPKTDEPTPPKPAKKPRATKAPKTATGAPGAPAAPGAEPTEPSPSVTPGAPPTEPAGDSKKKWYAVKVQSGREDSIKAAILRKVRIEGLEEYFGRIEIPVEEVSEKKSVKVKDKKTGEVTYQEKKVTRKKKKFQGYLFAELEFNDRILYLFRETSGVGDFLNLRQKHGQPPTPEPMPEHEVQSMLTGVAVKDPNKKVKQKIDLEKGDKVRIREGSFANYEGEVKTITEAKDANESAKVIVMLTFWGRPLDVEVESQQVEKV
jgi:transcriptional antiterminator NusG